MAKANPLQLKRDADAAETLVARALADTGLSCAPGNLLEGGLERAQAKDVVAALRHDGYRGRTVTLKIRFSDFETHTRSLSLKEPSDSKFGEQVPICIWPGHEGTVRENQVHLLS